MTPTPLPATDPIFGKLSLAALPLHEPILIVTFLGVAADFADPLDCFIILMHFPSPPLL